MILCFSGTGNSRYVAGQIVKGINDEILSLNERIKREDFGAVPSLRPLGFVTPTYAWRIPRIVEDFIQKTEFTGNNRAFFVMTCGSDTGNAVKYLRKLCAIKKLDRTKSTLLNFAFYPVVVSAKGFTATDSCISYKKCEQVCPLNNIRLENDKPVWGQACTHCMACISVCPPAAIEYKQATQGKTRHYLPLAD
jgi:ferredoxin